MRRRTSSVRQKGAVLFIALIALVIMMMGVLALLRSVDSATGIAGNIGFRQQGVAATDIAVEAATNWLAATSLADLTTLEGSLPADGYYANQDFGVVDGDIMKFDWGANAHKLNDQNAYQLWYVIHRLCSAEGPPGTGTCSAGVNTLLQSSDVNAGGGNGALTPLYRITARALGPRNSESVVQVIAY